MTTKLRVTPETVLEFLTKNNRQKFNRKELAEKMRISETRLDDHCEFLKIQGLIEIEKSGGRKYIFSADYVESVNRGEVVKRRSFRSAGELKFDNFMKAAIERCDMSRSMKTVASNVRCRGNLFVLTGGFK